jgi:perosamine synthetase
MQIFQMQPWIGEEERAAVNEYMTTGGWLTEFKKTEEFARMVADYVGSKHAFILSNGTVTLYTALSALGIGPGDEVIVPDFTMIATANVVVLAGATPIFVDIDPTNLCLDLDLTEAAITKRTRAIMLASMNGRALDMHRARQIADKYNLALIEDAAQSLGSRWQGQHLGTFGDIGSFSFSAPKIITTGQGGALVTDNDELAEKIRLIRNFGRKQSGVDFHECIGYNFKFTDLQAVIGIEQMKKLDWRVRRKKEMFALYSELLKDVEQVTFLPTNLEEVPPWFIDVLIPDPIGLQEYLNQHVIGSRPFYPSIHSQPAYGLEGEYPQSSYASKHGLWLPSSSFLSDGIVTQICNVIREFYKGRKHDKAESTRNQTRKVSE